MSNMAPERRLSEESKPVESKPAESTLTWDIFQHQERRLAESSLERSFDELHKDAPDYADLETRESVVRRSSAVKSAARSLFGNQPAG